ncbi:hypothetical protein QL285_075652 [Trifolium repens]|nr:hypothetical protein QL285_075652 [Trifolium repens]
MIFYIFPYIWSPHKISASFAAAAAQYTHPSGFSHRQSRPKTLHPKDYPKIDWPKLVYKIVDKTLNFADNGQDLLNVIQELHDKGFFNYSCLQPTTTTDYLGNCLRSSIGEFQKHYNFTNVTRRLDLFTYNFIASRSESPLAAPSAVSAAAFPPFN